MADPLITKEQLDEALLRYHQACYNVFEKLNIQVILNPFNMEDVDKLVADLDQAHATFRAAWHIKAMDHIHALASKDEALAAERDEILAIEK